MGTNYQLEIIATYPYSMQSSTFVTLSIVTHCKSTQILVTPPLNATYYLDYISSQPLLIGPLLWEGDVLPECPPVIYSLIVSGYLTALVSLIADEYVRVDPSIMIGKYPVGVRGNMLTMSTQANFEVWVEDCGTMAVSSQMI